MFGLFGGSQYDPAAETPNLSGRIAVVTGGNAGIGYESVKHLASHGATVYLAARNEGRATEAISKLRAEGAFANGGSVEFVQVDFSSVKGSKAAGEQLAARIPKLHILLNSAGMLAQDTHAVTKEGIVDTLATNHFGPFAWTEALLPSLKSAAAEPNSDVRIVIMASEAYKFPPTISKIESLSDIDVCKDKGLINAMRRYGMSKLCDIWFMRSLHKRLDAENVNITVMAVDPGSVASPGAKGTMSKGLPWPLPNLIWPIIRMTFVTPAVGAYSSTFAASSRAITEDRAKYNGTYILPANKITELKGQAADNALAEGLWVLSEKVVREVMEKGTVEGL